jgi:hypothetical protein
MLANLSSIFFSCLIAVYVPAKLFCFYFHLDLHCAAIDEQLDACNVARIIGCQKERSGRYFMRLAPSTHWDYGNKGVLHFLRDGLCSHGSIYRTWTNDIDPDLSFELGSPSSGERTDGRFAGAVHASTRKSLHSD